WDNDGDLDLAIGNNGQRNQIYENISGTLQLDLAQQLGWQAAESLATTAVAWGDWNNDGSIDLAIGNDGQPDLIYTNNQGALSRTTVELCDNAENIIQPLTTQALTWGDWYKDGGLDLIASYRETTSWAIYRLQAQTNQQPCLASQKRSTESRATRNLALGDADGDGDLDLAITYEDESSIYLNSVLRDAPKILLGDTQTGASALAWGDIDNDGDFDLVVEQDNELLEVYNNQLQGSVYLPNSQPVLTVQRPVASPATNSSIPTQLLENSILAIPYSYFDPEGDPIGRVEAFYSVNGGGVWLPATATTDTINTAVASNFALHLDGRDDLITLPISSSQAVTQAETTLTTRIKFDSITGTQIIYEQGNAQNSGLNLYLQNGRLYAGAWSKNNDWNGSFLESPAVNANQWYDIAVVHHAISKTMVLYIDGQAVANVQAGVSEIVSLTHEIALGSILTDTQFHDSAIINTAAYLSAYIDQLTVWNKALTPNEVKTLPETLLSGKEEGLLHLWTFDEGLGEQIQDTAAGLNGTLQDNNNNSGALWVPQPTKRIFYWDTVASGLFGRVDNAAFRLLVYPQVHAENEQLTGTFQYPNSTPNNFQRAAVSARSYPFRVQGTQLKVVNDRAIPVENALIYHLSAEQTRGAQPLVNNQNGAILTTDNKGALRGRGTINAGDQLIALHPLTTSYRVPPQIFLDGRDSYLQINNIPVSKSLTLEYWLLSNGQAGTLFSHPALTLTYQSQPVADGQLSSLTTFTLTAAHQAQFVTFNDQPPLNDGFPHHVAFSWQADNGEVQLILDGQTTATDTLAVFTGTLPVAPLQIGRGINGSLDELRLWTTTRSAADISATMFITISPHTANLAGYWPVEEGESGELKDLTPYNLDGRLIGGAAVRSQPLYRVYQSSAPPTPTGLAFQTVNIASQQVLTTSAANVLMLFDLTVSLEWDASMDPEYQAQLKRDIERASEILFDLTNGQIAFGRVTVYQGKQQWDAADVQIYASNNQRPNANLGGIVTDYMTDTLSTGEVISNAYLPGKIRMGATWNRYGNPGGTIGEDWPRALAHEFGHYALFLFDNYLGIDASKIIIETNCQGSAMTDAYRLDYSEFLDDPTGALTVWDTTCALTLAEQTTGRSDWETLQHFYPFLNLNQEMTLNGPNNLPLAVTQVRLAPFASGQNLLPIPIYYTADAQGNTRSFNRGEAQAYLLQQKGTDDLTDDDIIYLGTVNGPLILARGAAAGDRLCIFDNSQQPAPHRCQPLTADTSTINLQTIDNWQPEIVVRPINSQTLIVTVTLNTADDLILNAQIFPGFRPTNTIQALTATLQQVDATNQYTAAFRYPLTIFDGYVRLWSDDGAEFISRFMNAPGWNGNTFTGFGGNRFVGFGGNRFVGFGGNRFVGFGGNRFVGFGGNRFVGFGGNRFVGFGG
ncbi:MAG: VCBS repeat-containing protein, partial [Anaerolineales bacterium]|nr:VCBS repeat-containing protein [Anaerolineales bacterium]